MPYLVKRHLLTITAVALLVLLFCGKKDTIIDLPQGDNAGLQITVLDAAANAALPGATIIVYHASSGTEFKTGTTDNQGICLFDLSADSTYNVSIAATGYTTGTISGLIGIKNDTLTRSVSLTQLTSPATVKVTVVDDSTQAPIPGANVGICKASTTIQISSATTNNDGICSLTVESGSTYYLGATAQGYMASGAAQTFQVVQNGTVSRTLSMTKIDMVATIKVTVTDESSGAALSGALVAVYNAVTNAVVETGSTDGSGVCQFTVANGSYYLTASSDGYISYPLPGAKSPSFWTTPNATTTRAISLPKISTRAMVKVVVTDDSTDAPIFGINVSIYRSSTDSMVMTSRTDSSGTCFLVVDTGSTWYLKTPLTATYNAYPQPGDSVTRFAVIINDTTTRTIELTRCSPWAMVRVYVCDDSTAVAIPNADIVIFNANTNIAITRMVTDAHGVCSLIVKPNTPYFLRVAAQDYRSSPPKGGSALPFEVGDNGDKVSRIIELKKRHNVDGTGTMSGYVKTSTGEILPGALVVIMKENDSMTLSGVSGHDGFFIMYNVPIGLWEVKGFVSGWYQTVIVDSILVLDDSTTSGIIVTLTRETGSRLNGRITFLASHNSEVDITLVHPLTYDAIPGLNTFNTGGLTYSLDSIPPGTYIPWASYRNDGYVMDPDWIRKSGLPVTTFILGDSLKTIDFSITDAVPIVSPTNHPDTITPRIIQEYNPTFVWKRYPSTQEYIVGVYDASGNLVWGGYDSTGRVLHPQLSSRDTSVVYNFDSSGIQLSYGTLYRWKVWADKGADTGVQQLISSSEDLMGLFAIWCAPAPKK
jgi:hypothetical protein